MKTELNLIPEIYRAQLRRIRLLGLLKNVLVATLFYLIFVAVSLLAARYVLQHEFVRIVGETSLVTSENRGIESSVRSLNNTILEADRILSYSKPWSEFLVHFSSLVPGGIRLRSIDLTASGTSTVEGVAATREALINFRNRLSTDTTLREVELPVSTLLTKENIDFKITFTAVLATP